VSSLDDWCQFAFGHQRRACAGCNPGRARYRCAVGYTTEVRPPEYDLRLLRLLPRHIGKVLGDQRPYTTAGQLVAEAAARGWTARLKGRHRSLTLLLADNVAICQDGDKSYPGIHLLQM